MAVNQFPRADQRENSSEETCLNSELRLDLIFPSASLFLSKCRSAARADVFIRKDFEMLYAVLCYNDENVTSAWSKEEDDAVMGRLLKVQGKLAAQGRLGPVARLLPTTAATTLRKTQGEPLVIDGPFAETKEQLLGFYLIDSRSLDEALEAARELAAANPGVGSYEIRPVGYFAANGIAE